MLSKFQKKASATSSDTNKNPIIGLGNDPTGKSEAFFQSANYVASLFCTDLNPRGLFGLHINASAAKHRTLVPDIVNADGVLVPAPRASFPRAAAIPAGLPQAAQTLAIHNATVQNQDAISFSAGYNQYKSYVIDAAGPTVCNELQHPEHGLAYVEVYQILEHVADRFATPDEGDIAKLNSDLCNWPATMTLTEFVVFNKLTHGKLEKQNQKKSQYDMMLSFETALKQHPAHLRLITQYKELVDHKIADRTFEKMTKHVLDRIRDEIATTADTTAGQVYHDEDEAIHATYGRSTPNGDRKPLALTNTANPAAPDPIIAMLLANTQQMKQMQQTMQAMTRFQSLSTAGHSDPDDSDDDRQYCFAHGYDKGHTGLMCAWMKKPANAAKYNDAMRAAKAPCKIEGLHGSTTNA